MAARPIIVISQVPPPVHGSTQITKILLEVLDELGERPLLVDRRFSKRIGEVGSVSLRKLLAGPSLVLRLVRAVLRRPVLCVFFCTNRPFSFLVDVALNEVLRVFRVPTVNYLHTRGYRELAARGKVWRVLVTRLLGSAKKTVCLGQSLVAEISEFVDARTVTVINNTVERPQVELTTQGSGDILFLSNLIEEKGADVFVEAAIQICAKVPEVTFSLVGPSVDEHLTAKLRDRVARSGNEDRIRFLGPHFGADKWEVLLGAAMLVFPTRYRYEAQPLTIIEAFSVGVPVVASDVGAIGELVVDGENGRLLEEATVDEVARAILNLIAEPSTVEGLSQGARQTFEKHHSREVYRSGWARVIAAVRK